MVEKLDHSSLNLPISWLVVVKPLCADGIDFINEYNSGRFGFCQSEGISDHFWSISNVHLHQWWSCKLQECCFCLTCACSCHHCFACTRRAEHQTTLWWSDSNFLKFVFMGDGKNNSFSEFFDLFIESTNVSVLFWGSFIYFHGFNSVIIFGWKLLKQDVGIFVNSNKLSRFEFVWID